VNSSENRFQTWILRIAILVLAVLLGGDLKHDWSGKEHGKFAEDLAIMLGFICITGPSAFGVFKNGNIIFARLGCVLIALGFIVRIWGEYTGNIR
jgi:hypothetical protein